VKADRIAQGSKVKADRIAQGSKVKANRMAQGSKVKAQRERPNVPNELDKPCFYMNFDPTRKRRIFDFYSL
jgi:hypothetical protein